MEQRMAKKHITLHKNLVYRENDKVLVRIQGSRQKVGPKLRHVVDGTIVKKGKNSDDYQVIHKWKEKNGSL